MSTSIKMCDGHAFEDLQKHAMTQPCEIAVLWDDSADIKKEFDMILDYTRRLPDYSRMGENFARMAVLRYGGDKPSEIVLKLTSDEKAVRSLQATMQQGKTDKLSPALPDVNNEFANARPNAKKIVFIMANGNLNDTKDKDQKEAKATGYEFCIGFPSRKVNEDMQAFAVPSGMLDLTTFDSMTHV